MELKKNNLTIKEFNSIQLGLEEIKKIQFERVILMLSKNMFKDFIQLFEKEKNKICCSLNVIVFTNKNKKLLVEEICNNNKEISSGYIFYKTNIFCKIKQVTDFINKEKEKQTMRFEHFEIVDENNKIFYDEKMVAFEKIENFEELILPIYFHKIIESITLEEIHNFNYYLLNSFGKEVKKIISQLENIAEMPTEIICKYWAKIYTLQNGKFYKTLNVGLKKKIINYFFLLSK